jgi:hypothetical protein
LRECPDFVFIHLHRQLSSSGPDHERTLIARQIEAKDRQIDALVYELYGLTEEEIRLVEAGGKISICTCKSSIIWFVVENGSSVCL